MTPAIGERVRAVRQERGLSLRKLAESIGVSPSLISQIENGKTQPSVHTLYAIVNRLDLTVDQLMDTSPQPTSPTPATTPVASDPAVMPGDHPVVTQRGEHPKIEMENGVTWERIAAWGDGNVDILLVTYEPGGSSSVERRLMRHPGFECAYVLEGTLTLHLDFDTYEISPGSSLQFSSLRPHMYVNNSPTAVRGLWFQVGRHDESAPPAVTVDERPPGGSPVSPTDVLRIIRGMS